MSQEYYDRRDREEATRLAKKAIFWSNVSIGFAAMAFLYAIWETLF